MNNHPLVNPETGEIEWVARNITVLVIIIGYDEKYHRYILANQRGPKTPDPEFRGCWCMPCGYLDYNETTREAAVREAFEETGIKINPKNLILDEIDDDPYNDKRQNVTFHYRYTLKENIEDTVLTSVNSEDGEVMNIKWIPFHSVQKYKWAFNHDKIIEEL